MHDLILASGSSRRCSLLDLLCLRYSVHIPNVDESCLPDEKPSKYVERVARLKAQSIYEKFSKHSVLAADTIVSSDEIIIGKPNSIQNAKEILHKLSGNMHDVYTAIYLLCSDGGYHKLVKSTVKFKVLTDTEIEDYCMTNEPYDKAGAYAIQGAAVRFIEFVSGSYTNVIGLPLLETHEILMNHK